ncbi:MAG: hypothetical protein U0269_19980 [Polyangiales bacterium]
MSNYRVAVDDSADPLAISTALAAQQTAHRMMGVHLALTLLTAGLWLPVLIWSLFTRHSRAARAVDGYSVRVVNGQLFVGTREQHTLVPLERIRTLSTAAGVITVDLSPQAPLQLFGVIDPLAASQAILAARDEKLLSHAGASSLDGDGHAAAPARAAPNTASR